MKLRLALLDFETSDPIAWQEVVVDSEVLNLALDARREYDHHVRVISDELWREYISPKLATDDHL